MEKYGEASFERPRDSERTRFGTLGIGPWSRQCWALGRTPRCRIFYVCFLLDLGHIGRHDYVQQDSVTPRRWSARRAPKLRGPGLGHAHQSGAPPGCSHRPPLGYEGGARSGDRAESDRASQQPAPSERVESLTPLLLRRAGTKRDGEGRTASSASAARTTLPLDLPRRGRRAAGRRALVHGDRHTWVCGW